MNQTIRKPLADIVDNLKIPQNLDSLVTRVARLEYRTKAAIVGLALARYIESRHPELIEGDAATNARPSKGVAK